jgi:hypothetical protein
LRLPGEPEALAATSHRKKPQEGRYISLVDGRAKRALKRKVAKMDMDEGFERSQQQSWLEQPGFAGLDWASQKHSVVVVDSQGKAIKDFQVEDFAKRETPNAPPYRLVPSL